jgi:hypothetical protein
MAQIGLKKDMNRHDNVFLTTGPRVYQIREEYAWVLLVTKMVNGEERFPLSRNRLARVFPEYEMVYCRPQETQATAHETRARNQDRAASGKFQTSAEKRARQENQMAVGEELQSIKEAIEEGNRSQQIRDEALQTIMGKLVMGLEALRGAIPTIPMTPATAPNLEAQVSPPNIFLNAFETDPRADAERNRRQQELAASNPFQSSPARSAQTQATRALSVHAIERETPTPASRRDSASESSSLFVGRRTKTQKRPRDEGADDGPPRRRSRRLTRD